MSVYRTYFAITEHIVHHNRKEPQIFHENLPHHDFICETMCRSWNGMQMESRFSGKLKDKITAVAMTHEQGPDNMSYILLTVNCRPGLRMTRKTKNEIEDQITRMLKTEWENSFFGKENILHAPDGTDLFVTQQ